MALTRILIPTHDGAYTLYRPDIDESYHSRKGALQESRYVFIQNGLDRSKAENLKVLEIGWGTGLNGILSLDWSEKHKKKLFYHTLETLPLIWEEFLPFAQSIQLEDSLQLQWQELHRADWDKEIKVTDNFTLLKEQKAIQQVILHESVYDVIFFDAFAPSKQPEMWEPEILQKCFDALQSGGILTTYCAQGQFKRNLKAIGFNVISIPGPQGKIEMTIAEKH